MGETGVGATVSTGSPISPEFGPPAVMRKEKSRARLYRLRRNNAHQAIQGLVFHEPHVRPACGQAEHCYDKYVSSHAMPVGPLRKHIAAVPESTPRVPAAMQRAERDCPQGTITLRCQ